MTQYFKYFRPFAAVAWLAGSLLACSSKGPQATYWLPSGGASAQPPGGAAGEANVTPPAEGGTGPDSACETNADCDDELACNGVESCAAGSCIAGTALACGENLACVETDGGACVFTDESPWVIYTADDDTVAQTEIYAVKRDLIGKMTPIKLNSALAEDTAVSSYTWSPDRKLLAIREINSERMETIELVTFGAGLPHRVSSIDGGGVEWSQSADQVAISSPSGVVLYDYSKPGQVSLLFSWPGAKDSYPHGAWSNTNDFVFATYPTTDSPANIYTTTHEGDDWSTRVLADATNLWWLRASPSEPEIVFTLSDPKTGDTSMYALATELGSEPKLLASEGDSSILWSHDGTSYLLLRGRASGLRDVLLGEGRVLDARTTWLAPDSPSNWARFAPIGKQVLLYQPMEDWGLELTLLDPAVRSDTPGRRIMRMERDGLALHDDTNVAVALARQTKDAVPSLLIATLDGYDGELDAPGLGERIAYPQVSAHGYFASYLKGVEGNLQGYYIDLRYGSLWGYKPMRFPGEGRVLTSSFDRAGTSLYYILERDSGARECWHIDLSGQIAAEPQKVSRDGRVRFCEVEP